MKVIKILHEQHFYEMRIIIVCPEIVAVPATTINPIDEKKIVDKEQNLLLTFTPTMEVVGIKIDFGKPDKFDNEEARVQWYRDAVEPLFELKKAIETGKQSIESVVERLELNPTVTKSQMAKLLLDKESSETRHLTYLLEIEQELIKTDHAIKQTAQLTSSDPPKCLELLEKYKS